jgi:D-alanine-D-alanine ligase
MTTRRIGLVFGGRSVEHKVSIVSARTVAAALAEAGFEVVPLGIAEDGCWLDPQRSSPALSGEVDSLDGDGGRIAPTLGTLLEAGVEAVFPLVHGTWGEDGALQGLCEMADLPYVGAGVGASAVAMDKLLCKRVLASVGIPVVDYEAVTRIEMADDPDRVIRRIDRLGLPLFVKPSVGGSSVGITRVVDATSVLSAIEQALGLSESALVERAVSGRELECSLLGYPRLQASAVGEIRPGRDFYDYSDKYIEDGAQLVVPAALEAAVEKRLRDLAIRAFAAVGGTGMARADFLLEGDALYVNEINTVPGFTAISMYPKLWAEVGVSLPTLVRRLVDAAVVRHRARSSLDERIKAFLESLSGTG